jgi:hypothetical protein
MLFLSRSSFYVYISCRNILYFVLRLVGYVVAISSWTTFCIIVWHKFNERVKERFAVFLNFVC